MARVQSDIASFISGEVTPALLGRSETDEYPQFLSTAENVYVEKHGGIKRRGGLKMVNETRSSKVRLVPFIFSRTDSYVMEFGDRYMRLFQDSGYVENVGSVQTYLGDGSTTKFQFPHGLEQDNFAGDGVQTVFTYTFTHEVENTFAVWLYTTGGGWVKQVETTDYTHNSGLKTVTMIVAPPDPSVLAIFDASITEADIEVFVTVNGEIPEDPVDPGDYTAEPINTLDNILSPFGTPEWDGDAETIGTSWTLPNDGTATAPIGSEPVLKEVDISLTHGAIVDFRVDIDSFSFTEGINTASNTSNVPLISGDPYITIESYTILVDQDGADKVQCDLAFEDTSGTHNSNFFWEIHHNDSLISGAEGTELAVSIAQTIDTGIHTLPTLAVGDVISLKVRAVENNNNSQPQVSGSVTPSSVNVAGVLNPNAQLHVSSQDSGGGVFALPHSPSGTTPYTWTIVTESSVLDPQPLKISFWTDPGLEITLDTVFVRNARSGWTITMDTAPPLGEALLIRDKPNGGAAAKQRELNQPEGGDPFEVQTPFSFDELDQLYWAQANDIMIFCHYAHKPWRLTRQSAYEWIWDQPTLFGAPWDVPATSHSAKGSDGSEPNVKKFDFYFAAQAKADMEVRFNGVLQDPSIWNLRNDTFPIDEDGSEIETTKTPAIGTVVTISHITSDYNPAFGYPRVVVFFQERLWFGGTLNLPQTLWGSRAADFFDFYAPKTSQGQTLTPDAAVEYTLAAYTHEAIEWLSSERVLIVGTSSTEHRLAPDEYISTDRLPKVSKMTDYGGGHQMPMYMGGLTCFVQQSGRQLRSFEQRSNMVLEEYESIELTWMANHMVKNLFLKEPYYALVPNNIAVMVREDGQLMTCMYDPSSGQMDAKDVAWSRQITDGTFESVCVIPTDFGHQVWAAVRRTADGVTSTFVEYVTEDFFMDSALFTAAGAPETDLITGLDHLEDKTLDIVIDGAVHPQRPVQNGQIQLDWSGFNIVAGLPYRPKIVTTPYTEGNPAGTGQGKPGRWSEIWVRLIESAHPLVNGKRPPVRHPVTPMGEVEPVKTGGVRVFNTGWSYDKQITIEQDLPLQFQMTHIYGTFHGGSG